MKQEIKEVTVKDLYEGYRNDEEAGVVGYGGKLNIRPAYQREFVYSIADERAVIKTILKGGHLGLMYWSKDTKTDEETGEETETYELMDGQQRTMSICRYLNGDYNYEDLYSHNQSKEVLDKILAHKLLICVCEGTRDEKLDWFMTINKVGIKLTEQELRNATYAGPWLTEAKKYFSATGCAAYQIGDKYVSGAPIRQDYLETALDWVSDGKIKEYMAVHQQDENADDLWTHYQKVINWIKITFPEYRKEMKGLDWGKMYKNNGTRTDLLPTVLKARVNQLMQDSDVTKKAGIYEYLLDGEEKHLNIRAFDDNTKRTVYERQGHKCPICEHNGVDKTYDIKEMEGDHITPWSRGGHTTIDNCQMLCKKHNRDKGAN